MSTKRQVTLSDEQLVAVGSLFVAGLGQAVAGLRIAVPGLICMALAILIILAVAT